MFLSAPHYGTNSAWNTDCSLPSNFERPIYTLLFLQKAKEFQEVNKLKEVAPRCNVYFTHRISAFRPRTSVRDVKIY